GGRTTKCTSSSTSPRCASRGEAVRGGRPLRPRRARGDSSGRRGGWVRLGARGAPGSRWAGDGSGNERETTNNDNKRGKPQKGRDRNAQAVDERVRRAAGGRCGHHLAALRGVGTGGPGAGSGRGDRRGRSGGPFGAAGRR